MFTTKATSPADVDSDAAEPAWRTRRFSAGLAVWALTALLLLGSAAFPASADTVADEQRFVELINVLRSEKGLNPLLVDRKLRAQARGWSQNMATKNSLEHSSNLSIGVSSDWALLGENIGVTEDGNVQKLFNAFVASPEHYRNIVDSDFGFVGIGVVYGPNDELWTTHRFMAVAEPRPAEQPTPTPSTAPSESAPPALPPPPDVLITPEPARLDIDLAADISNELDLLSSSER